MLEVFNQFIFIELQNYLKNDILKSTENKFFNLFFIYLRVVNARRISKFTPDLFNVIRL